MPLYIQMKTGSFVLPTNENKGERKHLVLHMCHVAHLH